MTDKDEFTLDDAQNLPWPIAHLDEVDDFVTGVAPTPENQRQVFGRIVDQAAPAPSFDVVQARLVNRVGRLEDRVTDLQYLLLALSVTLAIMIVIMAVNL